MRRRDRWAVRAFFIVWLIFLYTTEKDPFSFMALNTFLGYLPIEISFHLGIAQPKSIWLFCPLLILWLLFYPNAPYMLTDLFHLSLLQPYAASGLLRLSVPMWANFTALVISALTTGLLGFWSLNYVSQIITDRCHLHGAGWRMLLVTLLTILSSVGIFIGRFLRIHTIYLFLTPDQFIQPLLDMWTPSMWAFVALLTILQLVCYWVLSLILHNSGRQQSD